MSRKRNKKRNPPRVHTDDRGRYIWETYFVDGKQKRRKIRDIDSDGHIIRDMDEWLLANASDDVLHGMERWDLIDQRMFAETETTEPPTTMKTSRRLAIDFSELESAFDHVSMTVSSFDLGPCAAFLHLETGEVIIPEDPEEIDNLIDDSKHLELPPDLFEDLKFGSLDAFIATLPEGPRRAELERATRGKGAFRRFKDIVFGSGDVELKHLWSWFETRRQRERIVEWLRDEHIEPVFGHDIFLPPPLPDKRADLLRAVLGFTRAARDIPGVRRIALLGSLTTPKAIPKDVDLLVEIDDDIPLAPLARLARRLSGATMATGDGCGADVFLCNPRHGYLGRICRWKQCAPGIRRACQADHCGRREFLNDDLHNVRLDTSLVSSPPLDLWPEIIARTELPDDVRTILVEALP